MTAVLNLIAQSRLAVPGPRGIALVIAAVVLPGGTLIVPLVVWLLRRSARDALKA